MPGTLAAEVSGALRWRFPAGSPWEIAPPRALTDHHLPVWAYGSSHYKRANVRDSEWIATDSGSGSGYGPRDTVKMLGLPSNFRGRGRLRTHLYRGLPLGCRDQTCRLLIPLSKARMAVAFVSIFETVASLPGPIRRSLSRNRENRFGTRSMSP